MKKEQLNKKIEDVALAFGRPQTGVEALRALVTEITGVDLSPEVTYKAGQRFLFKRPGLPVQEYLLSKLAGQGYTAINLATGNARARPVAVKNKDAITQVELLNIFRPIDDAVPKLIS